VLVPPQAGGDLVVQLRSPPYAVADPRELGVVVWQAQRTLAGSAPLIGVLGEFAGFPQLPLVVLLYAVLARRRLPVAAALAMGTLLLIGLSGLTALHPLLLAGFAWWGAIGGLLALGLGRLADRAPPLTDRTAQRWLLVAFSVIVLLTFAPGFYSDGYGYFAYVRSLVVDGDLHFANEYARLYGATPWAKPTATGLLPNPWSIGPALFWLPLYTLVHALLGLFGGCWPADGYSEPYVVAVTLTTAFAALVFVLASYRLARRWVGPGAAALAALSLLLGSTLWYYSMRLGSFAHALSAAAAAVFVLAWIRIEERRSPGRWIAFGAASGVLMLIYWPCALLLLGPALTMLRRALLLVRSRDWPALWRLLLGGLGAAAVALVVFVPQMIAWSVIYGSPLTKPDTTPTLGDRSYWLPMLFAPFGVLPWTPILMAGFCGLFLLWGRDRRLMAALLLAVVVYFGYNSLLSDWHGSGAFGLRRLTALAPWGVIGSALIYQRLVDAGRRSLALFLAINTSAWMLMLLIRYEFRYFPDRTPLGLLELPLPTFYLSRTTMPLWELGSYLGTGYFFDALGAATTRSVALAALAVLAGGVVIVWWWIEHSVASE
jgi:hypothetical protein